MTFPSKEMLLYGVRRVLEAAKRQGHSGVWLAVEEVEALFDEIRRLQQLG